MNVTKRQTATPAQVPPNVCYSLADLSPPGLKQNLAFFALNTVLPRFMRLLTRIAPVWQVPGTNLVLVTGFDELQEVFGRPEDFEVPYEEHVKALDWENFLLALQKTEDHERIRGMTMELWHEGDLPRVGKIASDTSERILAENAGAGRIDLIQGLVKPVLLAVVEQYYGVRVEEEQQQRFFDGTLAASGFVFSGPKVTRKRAADAQAAVNNVWPVIDAAMKEHNIERAFSNLDTVLGRYYGEAFDERFPEAQMRSSMMGMIGGFLPTDTNASGRIMEVLLDNSEARSAATSAAVSGNRTTLRIVLREALRMNYILPVVWRRAAKNTYLGEGSRRVRGVQEGRILAMSLQAAMLDRRRVDRPRQFDLDRLPAVRMVYGHDFHYCVGAEISDTILVSVFGALLARTDVKRAQGTKTRWVGMYPWNLELQYGAKEEQ